MNENTFWFAVESIGSLAIAGGIYVTHGIGMSLIVLGLYMILVSMANVKV